MKILKHKRILIISPETWQHNFLSKHHYAITLAKLENSVYFLNPPSDEDACVLSGIQNLSILDYKPIVRGLNYLPFFVSRFFLKRQIRKIERLAGGEFDVVWSFDPYRLQRLDYFKKCKRVYFAADIHQNRKLENLLAQYTHLIVAPSKLILANITASVPKIKVEHAVADYFFLSDKQEFMPGKNKIKIGYVGNLQSTYLALDLLNETVAHNTHCDFLFVGEFENVKIRSENSDNIFFVGRKDNRDVPSFLRGCDILLLCYDTDQYWTQASNSHKIMEYLCSGKVVVSTRIAEYIDRTDLMVMPEKNKDLPSLVLRVSHDLTFYNSDANMNKRITFATEHTYEKELQIIDEALADSFNV